MTVMRSIAQRIKARKPQKHSAETKVVNWKTYKETKRANRHGTIIWGYVNAE